MPTSTPCLNSTSLQTGDTDPFLEMHEDCNVGSLLDDTISDLARLASDCSDLAALSVLQDFEETAGEYDLDGRLWSPTVRWGMRAGYEVSESLCLPLGQLRGHLLVMRAALHPTLVAIAWRKVASGVWRLADVGCGL